MPEVDGVRDECGKLEEQDPMSVDVVVPAVLAAPVLVASVLEQPEQALMLSVLETGVEVPWSN